MKINDRKKILYDWPPCKSPAFGWIVPCHETSPVSRKRWPQNWTQISSMKINDINKIPCDWPPLQVPWIRWNWSQVLKPRLFRENVDHIIGHKFPAWKITIERKSHVIGHPYRSPLFDEIGPRSWNIACFEKTLTSELHINFQHEN